MDVFLRINGFRLSVSPQSMYKFMMDLFETGRFEIKEIEPFLRTYVQKMEVL